MNKEMEALLDEDYKETVRVAHLKSGISITDIADSTGLTYPGVRNALNGKGSYWTLHKICGIIGLDINTILK